MDFVYRLIHKTKETISRISRRRFLVGLMIVGVDTLIGDGKTDAVNGQGLNAGFSSGRPNVRVDGRAEYFSMLGLPTNRKDDTAVCTRSFSSEGGEGGILVAEEDFYLVKDGETFEQIVGRFGLIFDKVLLNNPDINQFSLREGDTLDLRDCHFMDITNRWRVPFKDEDPLFIKDQVYQGGYYRADSPVFAGEAISPWRASYLVFDGKKDESGVCVYTVMIGSFRTKKEAEAFGSEYKE